MALILDPAFIRGNTVLVLRSSQLKMIFLEKCNAKVSEFYQIQVPMDIQYTGKVALLHFLIPLFYDD